jgi:hypothetical protein
MPASPWLVKGRGFLLFFGDKVQIIPDIGIFIEK